MSSAALSKPARSACSIVGLVPAHVADARRRDEREHELLARRVQVAGGAVQAREREPLHGAVDAAARERGLRRAGIGEARLADRAARRARARPRSASRRRRPSAARATAPLRVFMRRRSFRAAGSGTSASSASSAESRNDERKLRVTAPSSAPTSASRTRRSRSSCAAPRRSNGSARSGTSPLGVRCERVPQVERDRHLLPDRRVAVERDLRARRAARSCRPASRSCESSGATSASATTRPAWRAPIVIVPSLDEPVVGLHRASRSARERRARGPTPQSASAGGGDDRARGGEQRERDEPGGEQQRAGAGGTAAAESSRASGRDAERRERQRAHDRGAGDRREPPAP